MRLLPFLALSVLCLSACSNPRETLGLKRSAPDEFKVVKHAPLEMPTSYELPEPRKGAPRPQETAVTKQVETALLGERKATSLSQSEEALLQKAGTNEVPDDIRTLVDRENGQVDERKQAVAKRLLGIGDDIQDTQVLNAKEEAERLQKLNETP